MAPRKRARAKAASARAHTHAPVLEVRRLSSMLYIQDKEGRGQEWHWLNGPAHKRVGKDEFYRWAQEEGWYEQRIEYWRDVQYRSLEQMKQRDVARVVQAIDRLDDLEDAIDKMLGPKRDKDGKIIYLDGLPCFHLALPPYDRMVKAKLDVDARRDHYGERVVDFVLKERGGEIGGNVQHGQVVDMDTQLTAEEAREAARWLLLRRHKRLAADAQHDEDVQQEDGDG